MALRAPLRLAPSAHYGDESRAIGRPASRSLAPASFGALHLRLMLHALATDKSLCGEIPRARGADELSGLEEQSVITTPPRTCG